ncbi:MAG: hypothetical protein IKZ58_09715 [Selenomonadaceae bacterium]|nr:hypothetical protein [Selenomonadaceae bacterium]
MDYEVKTNLDYDAGFSTQDYLSTDIVLAGENYLATSADVGSNYAQEILDLVNTERANVGLSALSLSNTLNYCAAIRADELTTYYSHTRPDGTSCFTVFDDLGYSYLTAAENIAAGQTSTEEVMNAWMNSTGHRANILNSKVTELGIGFAYDSDSDYKYYWTQLFAKPYNENSNSESNDNNLLYIVGNNVLSVGSAFNGEIWLDTITAYYITDIDARENPNDLILAGDTKNNIIYDGSGNSSLWGGAGSIDDTLVGGSGAEMFWYGKYDGNDVITNAGFSDIVNLYDISLSDIITAEVSTDHVTARFSTGTTLIINDDDRVTPTFQLGDGGRYNYNRDTGQWQNV